MTGLPDAWESLRPTPGQMLYVNSPHRFNVVPAGRRSGKTARLKRKVVYRALNTKLLKHRKAGRFFLGAPTRPQAKQIYWEDMKALTQRWWKEEPSETELSIRLLNDSVIVIFGMDKPQRFEGQPWDGGGLDEFANMKPDAWQMNVRPALSDRLGWCDLIGVPEGRNHYFKLFRKAQAEMLAKGRRSEWGAFTWFSSEVLPASEIEAARADLDPLSFQQEYEASFINFEGRAYYAYRSENDRALRQYYDPNQTLIFCLDFNVAPGVAAVCQRLRLPGTNELITAVIGEVWIPDNSNTQLVCKRLLMDWKDHQGAIEVYGDATGGQRKSSALSGSDWDIAKRALTGGFALDLLPGFGQRVAFYNQPSNPSERARVNAVNTQLFSMDGRRRLLVDPYSAPHVSLDLEGVQTVAGGSGEIDKDKNKELTHISDALGYYLALRFPVAVTGVSFTNILVGAR